MPPTVNRVTKEESSSETSEDSTFAIIDDEPTPATPQTNDVPALYVPEGFDPKMHLHPDREHLADKARYLLHTIHTQFVFNHRKRNQNKGVRLKAEYLRNFLGRKHFVKLRDDLETNGVITCDHIARDDKSFEYGFSTEFRTQTVRRFLPTDHWLIKKLRQYRSEQDRNLSCPTRRHLRDQVQRVRVDFDAARNHLAGLDLSAESFADCSACLARLNNRDWYFVADKYGRVHHNVTCLKRELRQFLSVDGESLVELDIANAQPLFCGLLFFVLLENDFSMGSLNDKDLLSSLVSYKEQNIEVFLSSSPSSNQQEEQSNNITSAYTPLRCHLGDIVNNEVEDAVRYLKLCEEGQVYEYLGNKAGIDISTTKKRSKFKKKVFSQVLFARRHEMHGDVAEAFHQTFPSIWKMIREVKRTDYKRLAQWMQRLESQFVINRVVENFRTKNPKAFVMTIHDSVMVKPEHLQVVRNGFLQEFGKLGVHPALKSK